MVWGVSSSRRYDPQACGWLLRGSAVEHIQARIIAHERSSVYGTLLENVKAVVFFGVPHHGSDFPYGSTLAANLLQTVQLGLRTNKPFAEAFRRNSLTFTDISQSFIKRTTPLKIRTFYETEKLDENLV